jgi:hypothetical protein
MIKETEDRLAEIEEAEHVWPVAPESFITVRRGSMISSGPDSGWVLIEPEPALHQAVAEIEIGAFLRQGCVPSIELLRLIGTLLDETATTHADRSRFAAMRAHMRRRGR